MAVAFIRTTTSATWAGFSHVVDNYEDRILLVAISWADIANKPTAVAYGVAAMTKKSEQQAGGAAAYVSQLWYLVAPAVGTANVVVTAAGSDGRVAAISYANVNQGSPFGTAATASGTYGTATSVTVVSEPSQLVIDVMGASTTDPDGAGTAGPGQTERAEINAPTGGGEHPYLCCSEETGSLSTAMTWTLSETSRWAAIGVPLIASSPSPGRIVAYIDDLASDDRRLLDAVGNRLQPWEIRADRWVRYAGWAPPTSVAFASLVDDPTCGYIEEASWSSDSDVATTTTSRMDLGEIIIARASAQSTG